MATNVLETVERTGDYEAMPHVVFTSPQVASIGRTEGALSEVAYATFDDLSTNPYSTAPDWRDVGDE